MVILLVTVRVDHIARLRYPRPARDSVELYFIARVNTSARDCVAPGISGVHGLNHLLIQL
jgi:hypothetical protein